MTWTCAHCAKEFKYESEKCRHEQSHNPQFECSVCSKKFSFLSAVRRHEKQHERTGSVQCKQCGGNFRDETLLRRHIQYAHKGNNRSAVRRHEKQHERTGSVQCKQCRGNFRDETLLRRHIEYAHKGNNRSAVRRHEKLHERTGNVQCKQCGGNFRDETLLRTHMQYTHKGSHTCTKCGSTFNSEPALSIHLKTHKPESERRFHCGFDGCGKTFNFSHHLKHHEMTHSDIKQYFCKICGKGFIQLHHWKVHLKNHEPETWLDCIAPDCNKKFTNEYARKRHFATHKIKADSGISSDSSANGEVSHSKVIMKDKVLCSSCGEWISPRKYEKHTASCLPVKEENREVLSVTSLERSLNEITGTIHTSERALGRIDEQVVLTTDSIDRDIPNCTSILGGCIVTGNSQIYNSCLCAQITDTVDDSNEFVVPNENNNVIKLSNNFEPIDVNTMNMGDMPEFEQRLDGRIKIKENIDIEISNTMKLENKYYSIKSKENCDDQNEKRDLKTVLYNSCKDILGNCIVSGNGTIDDECLCAKMTADDQQMIAQEIEDITPCPKNTWLSERL